MIVDHLGQEPLYKQPAAILRGMIERGELEPRQAVLSESYLQQEHGVSRGTVRMAIGILRDEGLVITLSGRGTFVRGTEAGAVPVATAGAWTRTARCVRSDGDPGTYRRRPR